MVVAGPEGFLKNQYRKFNIRQAQTNDDFAMMREVMRRRFARAIEEDPTMPDNITVASWSVGLLVDYCTDVGASVLVKGIRSQVDVAYETPMAIVNRNLAKVETIFMLPDPAHAHVSSSLVRQVASLGGDVSPYVPRVVADFLEQPR